MNEIWVIFKPFGLSGPKHIPNLIFYIYSTFQFILVQDSFTRIELFFFHVTVGKEILEDVDKEELLEEPRLLEKPTASHDTYLQSIRTYAILTDVIQPYSLN